MDTPANSFFIGSSSFLQVTSTFIKPWISSNFCQIPPLKSELSALERKKSTYYLVATLAPSILIGSSLFFQVSRTTIKSVQSSNLGRIGPRAAELAALERLEKNPRLIMGGIL